MAEPQDRKDGLTVEEGAVMDHLIDAWNVFSALPRQHPSETSEFTDAIHVCQGLLARRVVRRVYPLGWSTHRDEG